jgi:methionine-rich copper-binding protein CopC
MYFLEKIEHSCTSNLHPASASQAVAHPKITSSPPAINPIITTIPRKYLPSTLNENGLFEMPEEAQKYRARHARRQEQE